MSKPLPQRSQPVSTQWVDLHTAAAAFGDEYHNLANKVSRGTLPAHLFPSERHAGKKITRLAVHRMDEAYARELERYQSRFAQMDEDACLGAAVARYPEPERNAMLELARLRRRAIQQYKLIEPKTLVLAATGQRMDSPAVAALCQAIGVESAATIRRWMAAFDRAAGAKPTPDTLQRAFLTLLPGRRGAVKDPDQDKRIKIGLDDILAIQGLYAAEGVPDVDTVWRRCIECCPRCRETRMAKVDYRFRGRYKLHKCTNAECGFSLSYQTVRRVIAETPEEVATLAREGVKGYQDRHAWYAKRDWKGFGRSRRVYGDHHWCDIFVYDPNAPTLADGRPRLFRPWISAWQCAATKVVAWVLGEKPYSELLACALAEYIKRFGIPEQAWADNGQDYLSEKTAAFCASAGIDLHHTLPSKRGGESHARSKPIERMFGTWERDFISHLPGACGASADKRRDDLMFRMEHEHAAFIQSGDGRSPFYTVHEFEQAFNEYIETQFHQLPVSGLDQSPLCAWRNDPAPFTTMADTQLAVLLLDMGTRVIRRRGITVDNIEYWHPEFRLKQGKEIEIRMNPRDRSYVIAMLDGRPLVVGGNRPAGWTNEDIKREREIERDNRKAVRAAWEVRQRAAAGITPVDQIMAERAEPAAPAREAMVAGGATAPVTRMAGDVSPAMARALAEMRDQAGKDSGARKRVEPAPAIPTSLYDLLGGQADGETESE